ncbi:MAG: UbiH/UbiF/VisC/COQ6 family ubiquinone biosynthesis hydroxylase [Thiogranum sp.]
MTESSYDVVIVGGGLVGLSLAAALGRADFTTAVVEAREPSLDWEEGSVDLRVYAVSRASENLLRQLGAWSAIEPRAWAYTDMHVWDAGGGGDIHFDSAELGEPALGHIIESRVMERALLEVLATVPSVVRICPADIGELRQTGDRRQVELKDGRVLSAALLVGADGKQSRVRDHAGIHARVSDYGQQALVAVVDCERGHDATAWQRFLPTGPLAFLPLRDGRCSIVWSATTDEARRLLALNDSAFCEALGEAFDYRLGKVLAVGERALFPLYRQHAERYVAPRLALVGDAAHVIHPLAGQGVNLGFKDVRELTAVLSGARGRRRDIGALTVLRRYERARKEDNLATMFAMDGFKHLFGSRVPPVRWLRNAGLDLVDRATPVKHLIMRTAMGL